MTSCILKKKNTYRHLQSICAVPGDVSFGPESSVEYQDLLAPAVEPEFSLDFSQKRRFSNDFLRIHVFLAQGMSFTCQMWCQRRKHGVYTLHILYSRYNIRSTFVTIPIVIVFLSSSSLLRSHRILKIKNPPESCGGIGHRPFCVKVLWEWK